MKTRVVFVLVVVLCAISAACNRDRRYLQPPPPAREDPDEIRLTPFAAGDLPAVTNGDHPYHGNAYALSEGKQLYSAFNCVGCHQHGGGGMGPALMDANWIYGSEPDQIYSTIVQGRPYGMPAFGGRVPPHQVWQLVAYVRSMSGLEPSDASPGRDDDLYAVEPELDREPATPRQTGQP